MLGIHDRTSNQVITLGRSTATGGDWNPGVRGIPLAVHGSIADRPAGINPPHVCGYRGRCLHHALSFSSPAFSFSSCCILVSASDTASIFFGSACLSGAFAKCPVQDGDTLASSEIERHEKRVALSLLASATACLSTICTIFCIALSLVPGEMSLVQHKIYYIKRATSTTPTSPVSGM